MSKLDGDVCERCRFWDFQETLEIKEANSSQEHSSVSYGQCRRFAPAALHESEGHPAAKGRLPMKAKWPYTEGKDWCGEWKPNA